MKIKSRGGVGEGGNVEEEDGNDEGHTSRMKERRKR